MRLTLCKFFLRSLALKSMCANAIYRMCVVATLILNVMHPGMCFNFRAIVGGEKVAKQAYASESDGFEEVQMQQRA